MRKSNRYIAGLSLLCGLLLGACGADDGPDLGSFGEAKKFDAFRVYYAGEELAGLPLTGTSGEEWDINGSKRIAGPSFGYGSCDPPSGLFEEGGCPLPLSIQNWSRCSRWPGQYPHGHRPHVFGFRGAKAVWYGDSLEIFTGRTTVVIYGALSNIRAAARQLRDVRQANPPTLLPRSAPGSLWGNWPCQRKRRLNSLRRQRDQTMTP